MTFIHEGNKNYIDRLVNFEKMVRSKFTLAIPIVFVTLKIPQTLWNKIIVLKYLQRLIAKTVKMVRRCRSQTYGKILVLWCFLVLLIHQLLLSKGNDLQLQLNIIFEQVGVMALLQRSISGNLVVAWCKPASIECLFQGLVILWNVLGTKGQILCYVDCIKENNVSCCLRRYPIIQISINLELLIRIFNFLENDQNILELTCCAVAKQTLLMQEHLEIQIFRLNIKFLIYRGGK